MHPLPPPMHLLTHHVPLRLGLLPHFVPQQVNMWVARVVWCVGKASGGATLRG